MREYKIFKTQLGYSIYRKKEEWKLLTVEFLNWHETRTTNKTVAKTFYTKEDVLSALVVIKKKDVWKKSD